MTSCRTFNTAIIEMTTNDKKQSHEPGMRSQRSKVTGNGKSCGGREGELFSDKSQYRHVLSMLTILDREI